MPTVDAALKAYPIARRYLIEHGRPAAEIDAMPPAKVVLLQTVALYEELNNEVFKAIFLPYAEGEKWLSQADRKIREAWSRAALPVDTLLLVGPSPRRNGPRRG